MVHDAGNAGTPGSIGEHALRREMGLPDLVLAQVLCVVGSSWVGVAARLGRAHVAFWAGAMAMFYLPLAAVVIYLNQLMPEEGGLYQWAKEAFGPAAGFLTAWNLWVYAIASTAAIIFTVPTDVGYMIGPAGAWIPSSRAATIAITGAVMAAIAAVAVRGLAAGKRLHNAGSIMILTAYVILLALPAWGLWRGRIHSFEAFPWQPPPVSWFSLAIFGQMTIGGLSGFEYVAILAGECRSAARTVGQSVILSAPVIAAMFILGTSSVLAFAGSGPIDLIGPIPQTLRNALGAASMFAPLAIVLLAARSVAGASLLFTGLTRLPMTAGWDHLVPAWFTRLHPRFRTPVNSIVATAAVILGFIGLSMAGVREQEANQLLGNASITHYAIAYAALFAIPLFGRARLRSRLPGWLRIASTMGLASSLVSLFISIYPIVDVVSRRQYAIKIGATVLLTNAAGFALYWSARRRSQPSAGTGRRRS